MSWKCMPYVMSVKSYYASCLLRVLMDSYNVEVQKSKSDHFPYFYGHRMEITVEKGQLTLFKIYMWHAALVNTLFRLLPYEIYWTYDVYIVNTASVILTSMWASCLFTSHWPSYLSVDTTEDNDGGMNRSFKTFQECICDGCCKFLWLLSHHTDTWIPDFSFSLHRRSKAQIKVRTEFKIKGKSIFHETYNGFFLFYLQQARFFDLFVNSKNTRGRKSGFWCEFSKLLYTVCLTMCRLRSWLFIMIISRTSTKKGRKRTWQSSKLSLKLTSRSVRRKKKSCIAS